MGRFVSIFFIVALGVAFYSGIRASEPSMRFTADQYFDDSKLMDLKVMGTMGLTKADIKAIGKVSGSCRRRIQQRRALPGWRQ